jgi:hypothetical protein
MIVLSDGSASTTNAAANLAGEIPPIGDYGWAGYCPDYTFCTDTSDPECGTPYCTDIDPQTRHFCNTDTGFPAYDAPGCDPLYDASDFTMDMADLAGLVTVRDNLAGNFIAMYSIGFGSDIKDFGEALMRYIADAGDNGNIDNNFYEDCRNDGVCGNEALSTYDPPGPCESASPREDCGQYWFAEEDSGDLDRIFSEIASRLFTRLAR